MKQVKEAQAGAWRYGNRLPRKPRRTLAEQSFFGAVDRRLSRQAFTVNIQFDKDGKRIHDVEENIA